MQLSGVYSDLSDSALDDAYAAQTAVVKRTLGRAKVAEVQKQSDIATEIVRRLQNVSSFARSWFGGSKFPKYDEIQKTEPQMFGFQPTIEARRAVQESASSVAASIKFGVGGLITGGVVVFLLAAWLKGKR